MSKAEIEYREDAKVNEGVEDVTKDVHAAKIAQIADEILPGVELNTDPAFERALVRKFDMRLLMMMVAIYIMNFLDRGNIAYGALGTLKQDLGLSSVQYATVLAIFYVGYLPMQLPSNIIVAKTRPSLMIPAVMCAWGAVNACTGATHNFGEIMAVRIILAFCEAPFFPAAIYTLSCFYTRREIAKRISILYSASLFSNAISGLLATAIMSGMDGKAGLASWRWLFIIEGLMTIPVAGLAFFVLPDYPQTTKWLTPEEKKLAMFRLAAQNVSSNTDATTVDMTIRQALKSAFTDPSTYLILFAILMMNSAASFGAYFPQIIATLGYNRVISLLLTAPPAALAAILSIINSWHADKTEERWLHALGGPVVAIVGYIVSLTTTSTAPRYIACFLMYQVYCSFGVLFSWVQTSTPTPPLKKAVVVAVVNIGCNLAGIYTSYLYPAEQAPKFLPANVANIVFAIACMAFATIHRFRLKRLNTQLDRAELSDMQNEGVRIGSESQKLLRRLEIEPTYRYLL